MPANNTGTATPPEQSQGWECPRCGRVNAPWVPQCPCAGCRYTPPQDTGPGWPTPQPVYPMFPQPQIWCCR